MVTISIKDKDYNCSLTTKATVNAEDRIGQNLLNLFIDASKEKLPSLKDLLIIFHESLSRYQHGIKFDDVYNLYDDYIEDGHTYTDFLLVITDIMKDGGLISEPKEEEDPESKN